VGLPEPSSVALPGYRFLTCLGQRPLGRLWTVCDPQGRERLAHCLLDTAADRDPAALARFRSLRHPALPPCEAFRGANGELVLVTDLAPLTLRDRFDQCRAHGLPGVPRAELLDRLAAAAAALDALEREHGLPHLGLHPGRILLAEQGRVQLADYGLAALFWVGAGRPAAALNGRYAAPELQESVLDAAADQYSLALIYAEMLAGLTPRSKGSGKSGLHRRPMPASAGSGLHRRPEAPGSDLHRRPDLSAARPIDLDLLPADDRAAIARALHDDPGQRHPSCAAFVQALLAATPAGPADDLCATLPLVAPFDSLMGRPPPAAFVAPLPDEVTAELIAAAGPVNVLAQETLRCIVHAGGAWEGRFPIVLVSSLLRLKLEGFRQHWDAQWVRQDHPTFTLRLQTGEGRGFWPRRWAPAGIDVHVSVQPPDGADSHRREAVVRLEPFGDHGPRKDTVLPGLGPRLFQSLRAYLQAHPEQRGQERWPFPQAIDVYPVLPGPELGEVLPARGRDVSRGGVCALTPRRPAGSHVYLHFRETPRAAPLAVRGRVVRAQPTAAGWYEVGVAFSVDGPAA
jgi:hypothetical protein